MLICICVLCITFHFHDWFYRNALSWFVLPIWILSRLIVLQVFKTEIVLKSWITSITLKIFENQFFLFAICKFNINHFQVIHWTFKTFFLAWSKGIIEFKVFKSFLAKKHVYFCLHRKELNIELFIIDFCRYLNGTIIRTAVTKSQACCCLCCFQKTIHWEKKYLFTCSMSHNIYYIHWKAFDNCFR